MARELPNVGTVSYNGFTFPAPFNAEVQALPIQDSSRRYIKYTKYTITIKTIIVPDDPPKSAPGTIVDDNIEQIRCALTKAGGSLLFVGQGLGRDFAVNYGTAFNDGTGTILTSFRIDPTFGPFPSLLSWRPAGSNRAVEITWQVVVTIPDCCESSPSLQIPKEFLEHNYSINWSIGENGATERTITGYYETPGYRNQALEGRVNVTTLQRSADSSWDKVFGKFPQLPGFRRTSNRNLSTDKRQVNYTIRDVEIPSDNAFYPYMINMEMRQRVSAQNRGQASGPGTFFTPICTISGQIEVAPGTPRHWAYLAFGKVAVERFKQARNVQTPAKGLNGSQVSQPGRAFLISYMFEEDIYGREFSFEFSWWFLSNITNVIKGSGLFQKINTDSPNWNSWTISMAQVAQSARGLAKLQHTAAEDGLIFNCDPGGSQPVGANNYAIKTFPYIPQFIQENLESLPQSGEDYAYADQEIATEVYNNVLTHDVSEAGPIPLMVEPPNPNEVVGVNASKMVPQGSGPSARVVQVLSRSKMRVAVSGTIVRVGRHPNVPTVTSIGNEKPVMERCVSRVKQIGRNSGGIPIYMLTYTLYLILPATPDTNILSKITTTGPEKLL